jgi:hypothetical protein
VWLPAFKLAWSLPIERGVDSVNFEARAMASPYLEWAKLRSPTKYDLATSGIMNYPLSLLPLFIADLEINGPTI